jgi:hypothetical protein
VVCRTEKQGDNSVPQPDWTYGPGRNYLHALKPDGTQKWRSSLVVVRDIVGIAPLGTVYMAHDHSLYAVDSKGARMLEFAFNGESAWLDFAPDGTIYLTSASPPPDCCLAMDLARRDGKNLTSASLPPGCCGKGQVRGLGAGGVLYALKADGTQKWKMSAQSRPIVGPDGTLYLTAGNLLYTVDPEGKRKWSVSLGKGSIRALRSPQLKSRSAWAVYVVGSDNLYAVAPSGVEKWKFPFTGPPSWLGFGPDGTAYVPANTAMGQGRVYALKIDGSQKWKFDAPGEVYGVRVGRKGAIYVEGGGRDSDSPLPYIYHTGLFEAGAPPMHSGGQLYTLKSDGTLRWELVCQADSGQCPGAGLKLLPEGTLESQGAWDNGMYGFQVLRVGPDDSLYFLEYMGLWGGYAVAVGPDGDASWQVGEGGGQPEDFAFAFGADGTVYLPHNPSDEEPGRGALYAFTPAGDQKWSFDPRNFANAQ